jgi:hypothetical protein
VKVSKMTIQSTNPVEGKMENPYNKTIKRRSENDLNSERKGGECECLKRARFCSKLRIYVKTSA